MGHAPASRAIRPDPNADVDGAERQDTWRHPRILYDLDGPDVAASRPKWLFGIQPVPTSRTVSFGSGARRSVMSAHMNGWDMVFSNLIGSGIS
jgi:hypothetical protein